MLKLNICLENDFVCVLGMYGSAQEPHVRASAWRTIEDDNTVWQQKGTHWIGQTIQLTRQMADENKLRHAPHKLYFLYKSVNQGVRSMQSIDSCLTEYGVWHPTHHGGCSWVTLAKMSPIIWARRGSCASSSHPVVMVFARRFTNVVVTHNHPHTGKWPVNFLHTEKTIWWVSLSGTTGSSLPRRHRIFPFSAQTHSPKPSTMGRMRHKISFEISVFLTINMVSNHTNSKSLSLSNSICHYMMYLLEQKTHSITA